MQKLVKMGITEVVWRLYSKVITRLFAKKYAERLTSRTEKVSEFRERYIRHSKVYTEETIIKISDLLKRKSEEYVHPIILISDEPYREIAYDHTKVPYITKYYDNTIVCYSYSKSLSLPGDRIGYILVPDEVAESKKLYAAICGAARVLGFVCAPSLFQKVILKCMGQTSDMDVYKANRDLLYNRLTELGFECVHPDGAFYLFVKAMEEDAVAFCEKAKAYDLLLVAGDDFGCPGYVRISYCVDQSMLERSFTAFKKLADEYQNI